MATFTVKHACGHEATHAHSGREAEGKQREAWLARQPCQACWRAREGQAASEQNQEFSLPPLDGSQEDISWAEVIRAKALAHSRSVEKEVTGDPRFDAGDHEMKQAIEEAAGEALQRLCAEREAAWWIENRFNVLDHVKVAIVAAISPILESRAS